MPWSTKISGINPLITSYLNSFSFKVSKTVGPIKGKHTLNHGRLDWCSYSPAFTTHMYGLSNSPYFSSARSSTWLIHSTCYLTCIRQFWIILFFITYAIWKTESAGSIYANPINCFPFYLMFTIFIIKNFIVPPLAMRAKPTLLVSCFSSQITLNNNSLGKTSRFLFCKCYKWAVFLELFNPIISLMTTSHSISFHYTQKNSDI